MKSNIQYFNTCVKWLLNNIVEDYINSEIAVGVTKKLDIMYKALADRINVELLTRDELEAFGFLHWTDLEDDNSLWRIPFWMYPLLTEDMSLYDTTGKLIDLKTFEYSVDFNTLNICVLCGRLEGMTH